MDQEAIGQKSRLSNSCAERNSLSFIFRLPTEILEIIFIHRARDYHSKASHDPTPTVPSWVNISYVCRRWRNVTLNCSTLWTYLFVTSPRWTEELLARSWKASLKLQVNPDPYRCEATFLELGIVEQVMNHVERIQELCLHLPFTSGDHCFFSKLSSRAPRLQNLKISTEDDDCSQWSSVLFDGDTPALRTLELTGCPVPWYSFKLSGLTTLSLNDVPVRFQQDTAEFLATLGHMQNLEHLHLDNSLASAAGFLSSTAFHTFQKVNLPHLSRVSIAAPLSTVIALLSCINIPLKTEVRLECHFERDFSLDNYTSLSSLLAQRFSVLRGQALSSPTIRSLGIQSAEWEKATLTFSASERDLGSSISISHVEWCRNIPLQIVIHFRPSMTRSDGNGIISDICCAMPLTNVQSVHVLHPPSCSAFWKHALGHLGGLRHLKLSRGNMPDLASALSLAPRDCTKKQDEYMDCGLDRVFAPALEELELYDILLSTSPPDDQQSLSDALSTRKESRGRVTMAQCAVVAEDGRHTMLDMVGRWESGHFHVVESA
ncbi:hypothetical protein HD554DRAFT_2165761 [Boletus coccyginus]|nr:hypothetical protein HD554DRAFT_2165761 [Boletus coccyginus]